MGLGKGFKMSANETAEAILIVIKRIAKWILFGLLAIALIIGCFIGYESAKSSYENRLKIITEVDGIKLDDKFSDFMFRNPDFKASTKSKKSKVRADDYENEKTSFYVNVSDNKVSMITYVCKKELDFVHINGLSCQDSGDLILSKYGKDVRILCLKDKNDEYHHSYRLYDSVKYGVRHHVVSNSILGFTVMSSSKFDDKLFEAWSDCE